MLPNEYLYPVLNQGLTHYRVSAHYCYGVARAYMGETGITEDKVSMFGGYGVIRVPGFQDLLRYISEHGFGHHGAFDSGQVTSAVAEVFSKYLR